MNAVDVHATVTGDSGPQNAPKSCSKDLSLAPRRAAADKEAGTVIVVGTTGFLGPYIVAYLIDLHPPPWKVFCINRRSDGKQRTLSTLARIGRDKFCSALSCLYFRVAHISMQHMGLTSAQAELLALEVDELVFNAWDPDWSLPLKNFEPLLRALRHAVDFCVSSHRRPRMTFVSSICAVGEWPRNHLNQPRIPERVAWDSASAMAHGYGESKCIAEQLLARAHASSGVYVTIVRAGQIGGPVQQNTPGGSWPVQGWLYSVIKASAKLGYWPTHVQPLDWIPVDALAKGIANVIRGRPEIRAVQVLNMVHPQPAPWNLLFTTLKSRFGLRAKEASLQEWLDEQEPSTLKLYAFLRVAGGSREHSIAFENKHAQEVLPAVVPITEKQLATWLSGWSPDTGNLNAKM